MKRAAAGLTALWAASVVLWLLAASGRGAPAPLERFVVGLAVVGALGLLLAWWVQALGRAAASRDPRPLLLPALLLLALAVRLVGLDHEIEEGFYLDEGTYSLAWLLPFPVLYLGLIFALTVVVARNLYPALPPLRPSWGPER